MSVESHVDQFPECKSCPLAQKAVQKIKNDPDKSDKDVYLMFCNPHLSPTELNASFAATVTREGSLKHRLRLNSVGDSFTVPGETIRIKGVCPHLLNEASNKVLKFLNLKK